LRSKLNVQSTEGDRTGSLGGRGRLVTVISEHGLRIV
jgi:hypothetical protein